MPRLRAPRGGVLPLHEHPGPLLHRLPGRHRHAAAVRTDGFLGLVRGLPRWALAISLASASRLDGTADNNRSITWRCSGVISAATMGVLVVPGQTTFTRTLGARSLQMSLEKVSTPPLEAA